MLPNGPACSLGPWSPHPQVPLPASVCATPGSIAVVCGREEKTWPQRLGVHTPDVGQRQGWGVGGMNEEVGCSRHGGQAQQSLPFLPDLPVPLSAIQQVCLGLCEGPMAVGVWLPPGTPSQLSGTSTTCSVVPLLGPGLPLVTSRGTTVRGSQPLSQMGTSSRTYFLGHISDPAVLSLENKASQHFQGH